MIEKESQRHGTSPLVPRKEEVTGEDGMVSDEEGGGVASNVGEERLYEKKGVHHVRAADEDIVIKDPFQRRGF